MRNSVNALLIATGNAGKLREIEQLFPPPTPISLHSVAEMRGLKPIDETGATFAENARLKAGGYALQTKMWSLADDSGLEVAALNGEPGVRSARFAGGHTPYDEKIRRLLEMMRDAGSDDRSARFVCAMAVSDPAGNIRFTSEGECHGRIAFEPRGKNGFGYDPIFIPDDFESTFAELSDDIKQQISHRGRAAEQIIRYILDFMGVSLDQSIIRL
ncbi:MAG: RdgB/HAM1 family non-canonical purine NTP pyrophosphatase [Pyrinomonadaceae bacterium]